MSRKIKDLLPIGEESFGLLIKWDMVTGQYSAQAEGKTISPKTLSLLLDYVLKEYSKNIQEAIEEEEEEKGETPPWLS